MIQNHLYKDYLQAIDEFTPNTNINTKDEFIIGAGLHRTGTSSLQAALNILGYNCYHNRNCMMNNDYQFWIDAGKAKLDKITEIEKQITDKYKYNRLKEWRNYTETLDFNKVYNTKYNQYNASVDKPSQVFYLDIFKYYKNIKNKKCKIILSIRDDNHKWYTSFMEAMGSIVKAMKKLWLFPSIYSNSKWDQAIVNGYLCEHRKMRNDFFEESCEKYWLNWYNEWNESVKNNIDIIGKDNLLIFNVKDGWKPLCAFLNKPIPNVSFPRSNKRGVFKNIAKWILIYDRILAATGTALTGVLCYYIVTKIV